MSELPRGWVKARLGDLVKSPAGWNPRQAVSDVFRYVDIEAVDNERQRIANARELPVAQAPSRARVAIEKGDVLFSLVRPYLKNIARVSEDLDGQVASTAFVALRPESGISTDFLFYQLVQDAFIKSIPTYGNSPPAARDDEFLDLEVPIAPANEQARIASKLEELLSDLDAGVAALDRARANLKRYRSAVLKAAVEGRLTEKWRAAHPNVEPASKLLERILTERRKKWEEAQLKKYADKGQSPRKGWKDNYSEPAKPDLAKLPELPRGWCWATVDQCAWEVTVGHVGPMKDRYESGGLPFLRSQNVRPFRFDRQGLKFISGAFDEELSKSRLYGGEVLAVRSGNIGDACVYPQTEGRANCADLVISRLVPSIDRGYVVTYLNSPIGRARVLGKQTGSALPHFNVGAMARSVVPLPPAHEQAEIASEVAARLSQGDMALAEMQRSQSRAALLRQAILKRAFEGKLVPQDPRDEPASELLARIREARAGEGKAQRRARGGNGGAV